MATQTVEANSFPSDVSKQSSASYNLPSRAIRRQNKSCDQCRKGKRACDALFIELAEPGTATQTSRCSYCAKTSKTCTFEWLRAHQSNLSFRPAKAQRQESLASDQWSSSNGGPDLADIPQDSIPSILDSDISPETQWLPFPEYVSLSGYPDNAFAVDMPLPNGVPGMNDSVASWDQDPSPLSAPLSLPSPIETSAQSDGSASWVDFSAPTLQSFSTGSEYSVCSGNIGIGNEALNQDPSLSIGAFVDIREDQTAQTETNNRVGRKRKRRQPQKQFDIIEHYPRTLSSSLVASTNGGLITENLMKIYHDSMENALSCWLNERTCPYGAVIQPQRDHLSNGMLVEWGSNWSNRIYKRVFKLDNLVAGINGVGLTPKEDKAATRALHLSILSFASQWAQGSQRSRAAFPYNIFGQDEQMYPFQENSASVSQEFDRTIQESTWQQARHALQDTAHIESFRVVFAHIVFGLTQKPLDTELLRHSTKSDSRFQSLHGDHRTAMNHVNSSTNGSSERPFTFDPAGGPHPEPLSELEDLADRDGPPIYLEQGLRHIHTMRAKLERLEREDKANINRFNWPNDSTPAMKTSRLSVEDKKTIDLLYWLAIMFDTLSAAIHQRPLVVSDEDSEIIPEAEFMPTIVNRSPPKNKLWGDHFFQLQSDHMPQAQPQRWPCSYADAARTLTDAAPVKVLLFRKITSLQTLLTRRTARPEAFEEAIADALNVYDYWNWTFDPLFQDCVNNHERLPHRVQSWYLCLGGHWYLATLLLADVIETLDKEGWGVDAHRMMRDTSGLVRALRDRNTAALAELANASCPEDDDTPSSFSVSGEWHDALSKKALLTEPWTAVLIRAFIKAGTLLVKQAAISQSPGGGPRASDDMTRALQRCRSCMKALWYLGRKSDMALMASELLYQAIQDTEKRATICHPSSLDFLDLQ